MSQVTAVRFAPRRLAHGNFFVSHLESSLKFYSDVCGLTLVFREPGISAVFLGNGSSHHDVALMGVSNEVRYGRDGQVQVPKGRGAGAGLNHLGFEMSSEAALVEGYRRAQDQGVSVHRTADHQIAHSVYFFDPEGNYLEMYADATSDWREVYRKVGDQLLTGQWDPNAHPAREEPMYDPSPEISRIEDAAAHPLRASRATLVVDDLERMLAFYRDVVGLSVLFCDLQTGCAALAGGLGRPDVALIRRRDDLPGGLHHFGLELLDGSELARAAERFNERGVKTIRHIVSPSKSSVVIRDPDGILLEFFVVSTNPVLFEPLDLDIVFLI